MRGCLLCLLIGACSAAPASDLVIDRVDPPSATNDYVVPVRIEGSGFHLPVTTDLDDGRTVIGELAVTVGDVSLDAATWRGEQLIEGSVPAGLAVGSYDVAVTLGGTTEVLPDGYVVTAVIPAVHETLSIPGTGGIVTSTFVPAAGVTYRLRASGFVQIAAGPRSSDAEYYDFPVSMTDNTANNLVDMGLAIDDTVADTTKTRWGPYADNHVYVIYYLGTGAPLTAQFHDDYYPNNAGSMTLEILPGRGVLPAR